MFLQVATSTNAQELNELMRQMIGAAGEGKWAMFAGFLLMALVYLAGKLKLLSWIPANGKRWFVAGVSLLGAIGAGLASGAGAIDIIASAVTVGLTAIGSWEVFGGMLPGGKAKDAA